VWDNADLVMETDSYGNLTRYYVVNGELMSFDRTASGITSSYYLHDDPLASTRKVTNSSGSVVATFDYDAWGNQLASTVDSVPNGGILYRFVGTGGVRWDPAIGRDPAGMDLGASLYTYCHNNPFSEIDPTGLGFFAILIEGLAGSGQYALTLGKRCTTDPAKAAAWVKRGKQILVESTNDAGNVLGQLNTSMPAQLDSHANEAAGLSHVHGPKHIGKIWILYGLGAFLFGNTMKAEADNQSCGCVISGMGKDIAIMTGEASESPNIQAAANTVSTTISSATNTWIVTVSKVKHWH
jgi:uncharacterized protein RhaS with RHS repeats